jgi:hypothetical protein
VQERRCVVERRSGEAMVWVEAQGVGAWVPERLIIAGLACQDDAAKIAAGWERVDGGWVVAKTRPAAAPKEGGR